MSISLTNICTNFTDILFGKMDSAFDHLNTKMTRSVRAWKSTEVMINCHVVSLAQYVRYKLNIWKMVDNLQYLCYCMYTT